MGCDIHLFIEYRDNHRNASSYDKTWRSLSYDQISVERSYAVFGALAGVRCKIPEELLEKHKHSNEPKGIPPDLSWGAKSHYAYFVVDNTDDDPTCIAKSRIRPDSEFYDEDYVICGDWHTPSWLTPEEFAKATLVANEWCDEGNKKEIADLTAIYKDDPIELKRIYKMIEREGMDKPVVFKDLVIINAILQKYIELGYEARVVFWFDN